MDRKVIYNIPLTEGLVYVSQLPSKVQKSFSKKLSKYYAEDGYKEDEIEEIVDTALNSKTTDFDGELQDMLVDACRESKFDIEKLGIQL